MRTGGATRGGCGFFFPLFRIRNLGLALCLLTAAVLLDTSARQARKAHQPSTYNDLAPVGGVGGGGEKQTADPSPIVGLRSVPQKARPVPLDEFPALNGHVFNADGGLERVAAGFVETGGGEVSNQPTTTLLFMHLWKCAGSSLRHLLRDWAEAKGQDIGIVVRCNEAVSEVGKEKESSASEITNLVSCCYSEYIMII